MIPLFNIRKPKIQLSDHDHVLHGSVVTEFEDQFAEYVGAKYAVGVSSCTMAIQLMCLSRQADGSGTLPVAHLPAMLPPVVFNAVQHSGIQFKIVDDPYWVGSRYTLIEGQDAVIDSAHEVKCDKSMFEYGATMLYSFYPTKPVGGIDGGMVCTNDKVLVDWLRIAVNNGMSQGEASWENQHEFCGWKAYLSTAQAIAAQKSLSTLDARKERIGLLRYYYNEAFGYRNTSDHLYQVHIKNDRNLLLKSLKDDHGIICGIHYQTITGLCGIDSDSPLADSFKISNQTLSIPFHEGVTSVQAARVVREVHRYILR